MEIFPTDVWTIILRYKKDMELLEKSPLPTGNTVMSCDFHFPMIPSLFNSDSFLLHRYTELLFGDCDSNALIDYIKLYVNLPLIMLNKYINALHIYRERLGIWDIPDIGKTPEHWGDTTVKIVQDYCENHDRELYTRRLAKLLLNNKTHKLFL